MSLTTVHCSETEVHHDVYHQCLVCEIERLQAENEKMGAQVARLQSSTGACALIRLEQKIERLVELVREAVYLYWGDYAEETRWKDEAAALLEDFCVQTNSDVNSSDQWG